MLAAQRWYDTDRQSIEISTELVCLTLYLHAEKGDSSTGNGSIGAVCMSFSTESYVDVDPLKSVSKQ